jgi:5-methyltetrahydropteroyltriglutamate--homocysteine methyltransferase
VKRWKNASTDWSHYEHALPLLAKSLIDHVSIETPGSGVDVGVIEAIRGKDMMLGVLDVGNETVETAEIVADACADSGMLPLSRRFADRNLRALAAGAALVNAAF